MLVASQLGSPSIPSTCCSFGASSSSRSRSRALQPESLDPNPPVTLYQAPDTSTAPFVESVGRHQALYNTRSLLATRLFQRHIAPGTIACYQPLQLSVSTTQQPVAQLSFPSLTFYSLPTSLLSDSDQQHEDVV